MAKHTLACCRSSSSKERFSSFPVAFFIFLLCSFFGLLSIQRMYFGTPYNVMKIKTSLTVEIISQTMELAPEHMNELSALNKILKKIINDTEIILQKK